MRKWSVRIFEHNLLLIGQNWRSFVWGSWFFTLLNHMTCCWLFSYLICQILLVHVKLDESFLIWRVVLISWLQYWGGCGEIVLKKTVKFFTILLISLSIIKIICHSFFVKIVMLLYFYTQQERGRYLEIFLFTVIYFSWAFISFIPKFG